MELIMDNMMYNILTQCNVLKLCRTCTTVSWTFRGFYEKVILHILVIIQFLLFYWLLSLITHGLYMCLV